MLGIDERALRIAWTVFLFALLLALIYFIRETLVIFAVAIFFAYMLSPIVGLVERFMPKRRTLALAIVYVLLIGGMVGVGFAVIPTIAEEATSLVTRLPHLVTGVQVSSFPLPHWLDPVRNQVLDAARREANTLEASLLPFLQQAGTKILTGLGYVLPAILVPILAFFLLKDARDIRAHLIGSVEDGSDQRTLRLIIDDIHAALTSYIRALVLLAIASFCAWAIFLSAMRYSYELLLAGVAGILEFIPVFGPVAALAIILVVAEVTGSGGLLWILVFFAIYRVFQDYMLNPYLMSAGVEIHPLLVLFGVLAGENLAGIPGMFFSIPLIAILKVMFEHLRGSHTRKQLSSS
ncbi:MAG: AI-2E family transporter [Acidobacteriaceae bacterium]|nr:AI-2E family transporter [Acidobacteriaceae bacterium]